MGERSYGSAFTGAQIDEAVSLVLNGGLTDTFLVNAPIGSILWWSGTADSIPVGWHICDGEDGTLDLRDQFILAAGDAHEVGDTGGEEEHTLTVSEMPSHEHRFNYYTASGSYSDVIRGYAPGGSATKNSPTQLVGSSQPHNNMPPYMSVLHCIKAK